MKSIFYEIIGDRIHAIVCDRCIASCDRSQQRIYMLKGKEGVPTVDRFIVN